MDFNHSDDRQMLGGTLARWLTDRYGIDARNRIAASDAGWSREAWSALAELGIAGALFGEEAGGFGGTGFDIAVVFEQIGRRLVVEPFLGVLMAGRVLAAAGGHAALIEAAIAGEAVLAYAGEEADSFYDTHAIATRVEGGRLTGTKAVVPQLAAADHIVVSAREGDAIGLWLVDAKAAGVTIRDYPLVDGGHGGELTLDGVEGVKVGDAATLDDVNAAGLVALAWEAVGVMDEMKTATLDYLRTRKQFGIPIGKFQVLQHRMATVALEIEQARSAAINAAAALDGDAHARDRAASAAKFTVARVGTLVAEEAIQMHGGIGMTWELPLSHYAKRLTMIGHQLGDEDFHLARYIALGAGAAVAA